MGKPLLKRTLRALEAVRKREGIEQADWSKIAVAVMAQVRFEEICAETDTKADALDWLSQIGPEIAATYREFFQSNRCALNEIKVSFLSYIKTPDSTNDDILAWTYQYLGSGPINFLAEPAASRFIGGAGRRRHG